MKKKILITTPFPTLQEVAAEYKMPLNHAKKLQKCASVSKYIVQKANGTRCPSCKETAMLLCREDGKKAGFPWFYICFECNEVREAGKGLVRELTLVRTSSSKF